MSTASHGPVAVVTGAASGIGAAVAAALGARGYRVAGLDLQPSETTLAWRCDVVDAGAVAAAVGEAAERLGPPDVLVTAAGHYEMAAFETIDRPCFDRMLAVHLGGVLNACRAVVPGMVERGRGTIVTVSSELALAGGCEDAHYAAAKGAVVGLTRSLAVELAPAGVRVNSVAPGPTDTPLLAADSPWRAPAYVGALPLRRLVSPEEVAATVLFVVEEGALLCGQVLSPNAGAVI